MNLSPLSYRPQIAIVGTRNVGKSRFVNQLVGKKISAVSEIAGTTTNPIKNPLELLPYGPVLIVDTAGIEEEGELGSGRITQTIKTISSADFVLLLVDARNQLSSKERELVAYLDKIDVGYIIVVNKIELGVNPELLDELKELREIHFEVSCKENVGFEELKRKMIRMLPQKDGTLSLKNLVRANELVLMVLPSDLSEEQNKLLSSHIQIIREGFDKETKIIICKDIELQETLDNLKSSPDLIITESHLVNNITSLISDKVRVTTFSILIARQKTELTFFIRGLKTVKKLKKNDRVLFAEACVNHPNNGKTKINDWLCNHSQKELNFDLVQNEKLPENLSDYKLVVHCDGCKLTKRAMQTRINEAMLMDVPVVNYGILSSYMNDALPGALTLFKEAIFEWEKMKK
ncbi:MAG: [FeFe] hydrogenase H-cluster maturation GTPase HydF [Ignavibacteriaceae bacterium]|nr:[FeFe] hydrogenase H-cluster maturation GTPase HydF [Ignavibacteriaceae bacterium]